MSSLCRVVEHVFGTNFLPSENLDENPGKFGLLVSAINTRLQSFRQNKGSPSQDSHKENKEIKIDHEDGRVGNRTVSLDILELSNRILSYDTFKIIGVSHFGTVKTNCGVCWGKWQYEVILLSSGVMQIGWATSNSKFGSGQGVGDTADSYAFDGSRIRKWNVSAEDYGEKWDEDDIIGCCIDLDDGRIEFYRNGTAMGVAYKDIPMGAGILYFPSISLQQKEGLIANFGSSPFCYPVPGCQPIQEPPSDELASVTFLLDCISKLLSLIDSRAIAPETSCDSVGVSYEALLLEIGKILILNIIPLLKIPYVMETKFVPFIHVLCESENSPVAQGQVRPSARASTPKNASVACASNYRKLIIFLDLLWTFSEESELKLWTSTLVSRLSVKFQHNMRPLLLEFYPQKDAIYVLHCLVHHRCLRHYLMNHVLFEGVKFPWFLNIKVPSIESYTFWETEPSIKMNKRAYMTSISRITTAMNSLEDMQINLLMTMMDDTDGSEVIPSSKSIFLKKFRILRRQFYALYRVDPLKSPGSPQFLVWPLFLRLSRLLELLGTREMDGTRLDAVPSTKFYDGSISYYDMDRLGGVLLYLLKTYYNDLEQRLGVSQQAHLTARAHGNDSARPVAESSTSTVRNITGSVDLTNIPTRLFDIFEDIVHIEPLSNSDDIPDSEEQVDSQNFLTEVLDGLVLFYYISAKTFPLTQNINSYESKVKEIAESLCEIKDGMKGFHASGTTRQHQDLLKSMELSYTLLLGHLHQATAHLTTLHAAKYTGRHIWLFKIIMNTMKVAAEDVHLFSFVPEFYLECMVHMLKALCSEAKSDFVVLENIADHEELMLGIVQFICDHIDDQRVRIAKAKDTLLSTLLEIVTTPNLVEVLHNISAESRMNMIRFLLQPYANRAWANSNWILVRIWHGSTNSFACGCHTSVYHKYKLRPKPLSYPANPFTYECAPYPSPILQEQIQFLLITEPEVATSFLNSVLNELNWAFSEFIGMLQELQNVSNRQERVLVESRQLKICAICFDLTLGLLRVLEMVSSLALPIFVRPDEPNSCFLLARLCQLLCQVLNRASSQDGCFHHITTLEIPGLENIDHLPVLTAVCGILLAILKDDIENFNASSNNIAPKVTKTLLMEPSFQISSFTFLLEEGPHLYSLNHYKEFISPEEISMVENMLTMLTHYHDFVGDTDAAGAIDEDDLCTICFAYPISATFEPCKHHSCRACITHHLMNCKNCFFCKAVIIKVVDDDGKVIYHTQQANQLPNSSDGT